MTVLLIRMVKLPWVSNLPCLLSFCRPPELNVTHGSHSKPADELPDLRLSDPGSLTLEMTQPLVLCGSNETDLDSARINRTPRSSSDPPGHL